MTLQHELKATVKKKLCPVNISGGDGSYMKDVTSQSEKKPFKILDHQSWERCLSSNERKA